MAMGYFSPSALACWLQTPRAASWGAIAGASVGLSLLLGCAELSTTDAAAPDAPTPAPSVATPIAQQPPADWAEADVIALLEGHSHPIQRLVASPDGQYLLGLTEQEMVLWDVAERQLLRFLPGHRVEGFGDDVTLPAGNAAFSADSRWVISAFYSQGIGSTESLLLWDAATGAQVGQLGTYEGCRTVAVAANTLVSACDDGVQVWDLARREERFRVYGFDQGGRPVEALALSPDGTRLATVDLNATGGGDGEDSTLIRLWQLGDRTAEPLGSLTGHQMEISQLAFSADGQYLVSVGFDQQVLVWDWQTRQTVTRLGYNASDNLPVAVALHPESPLVVGDFQLGEVLQLPGGDVVRDVLIPRSGGSTAYSFTRQGNELAAAGLPPTFYNPVVRLFSPFVSGAADVPRPSERTAYQELPLIDRWSYGIEGLPNRIDGSDPQAVALGIVPLEAFSDSPESPEISTEVLEAQGDRQVILVTQQGLADDSIANIRHRIEFAPVGAAGHWQVIWVGEQYQCWPNRGHQDWSADRCQ